MKSNEISRRKFIKNLGSGVLGTGVVLKALPAAQPPLTGETEREAALAAGKKKLSFTVNRKKIQLFVDPQSSLADVLRDELQLTGTKVVCNHGECGACTVLLNGKAVYSCHMLALDAGGAEVTTIEGLMDGEQLGPVQEAFVEKDGFQCGFCTPGQIMAAQALLNENPTPTEDQIKEGMSGNLCRCAAYPKIVDAVMAASKKLNAR